GAERSLDTIGARLLPLRAIDRFPQLGLDDSARKPRRDLFEQLLENGDAREPSRERRGGAEAADRSTKGRPDVVPERRAAHSCRVLTAPAADDAPRTVRV